MPGTLQLDEVGDTLPLLVVGTLSDGSSELVTYSPQISFSSSNQNVVTVDGRGNVAALAPGSAFINILGGSTPYSVYVNVAIPAVSSPSFSPPAGTYSTAQTVTLSDTLPGATIYYTTDGTLPTSKSVQYSAPLTVSTTETISALAVASGYPNSEVAVAKYAIVSPTTLTLSSSPNPANYGSQVTLTATLSPYSIGGQSTNGESVAFYNGGTSLGTGTLSSGIAAVNVNSLPVGTDVLTASYGGDAFLSDSVSAAIDETVVAPNYSLTISPGAGTVTQGGSVTETVTLSPVGGFQQQITFRCSGLPSYSACSFSPATLTPDGTNAAQKTTLTVSTDQASAALDGPHIRDGWRPGSGSPAVLAFVLLGLCVLPTAGQRGRRRGRKQSAFILMIGLMCGIGVAVMAGCGSGSKSQSNITPAGNYTVTVTGTAGSDIQTTAFTLTVQ